MNFNPMTLYESGLSLRQVSEKTGMPLTSLVRYLTRHGATFRPTGRQRVYKCDDHYFDEINSEEKAYWLGFLLADGHVNKRDRLVLDLASVDQGHMVKLRNCIESDAPVRPGYFAVTSHEMAKALRGKGIIANGKRVFDVDPDLRRHYWRGAVDGDGCLRLTKGVTPQLSIELVGTPETATKFRSFCLGIVETNAKITTRGKIDIFRVSGPKAADICRVLYDGATVYLARKKSKYDAYRIILDERRRRWNGKGVTNRGRTD